MYECVTYILDSDEHNYCQLESNSVHSARPKVNMTKTQAWKLPAVVRPEMRENKTVRDKRFTSMVSSGWVRVLEWICGFIWENVGTMMSDIMVVHRREDVVLICQVPAGGPDDFCFRQIISVGNKITVTSRITKG